MALQEISCAEIEVVNKQGSDHNDPFSVTSVYSGYGGNKKGLDEDLPVIDLSSDHKFGMNSNALDLSEPCENLPINGAKMPVEVEGVGILSRNGEESLPRVVNHSEEKHVSENDSPDSSTIFVRENSSDNSSSDTLSSDDPSFGNTTDEQLDSVHDDVKQDQHDCLSHSSYKLALRQLEKKQVEILILEGTVERYVLL